MIKIHYPVYNFVGSTVGLLAVLAYTPAEPSLCRRVLLWTMNFKTEFYYNDEKSNVPLTKCCVAPYKYIFLGR